MDGGGIVEGRRGEGECGTIMSGGLKRKSR